MIDFQALLLDPIYNALGVSASFTPANNEGVITLTVMDKTAGVDVGSGPVIVQSAQPAAAVRVSELQGKGLDPDTDLTGGTIEFNNRCWQVKSWQPNPGPNGFDTGEVLLLLQKVAA